ncbi:NmrA family NAD(P)-binding protein [Spirosoma sp. BT702]|uniref:NmrA family NAD(P)-binding protein n=1 Tax=Spirosoma profusum TaxID=2771354 RepID=A0A926XW06_9BACT|nr:NmrA family NAD(P)-binding protein [Spirosoma profusum]MBD2701693.1 NmrA family NAD(P)-binding protein [Spirosoma profusum]
MESISESQPTNSTNPAQHSIILAGATGNLGQRIAHELRKQGANVTVLIRRGSNDQAISALRQQGVSVVEVDFSNATSLAQACQGGTCVVSALSGLREVIVESQTRLLKAAIDAAVPRFIPSDYCIDYRSLPKGKNRNLDLRRTFNERLDKAPIGATSILNGMFTDLLTGQAPVILFKLNQIMYWGNADQLMDFTTLQNTAEFTAAAALDTSTPRYLRIAGQVASIRDVQEAAQKATGEKFSLLRLGGLGVLNTMIKAMRTVSPQPNEVFPPWQGMQYLRDMLGGAPKLDSLDNNRYPDIQWTPIWAVLANR